MDQSLCSNSIETIKPNFFFFLFFFNCLHFWLTQPHQQKASLIQPGAPCCCCVYMWWLQFPAYYPIFKDRKKKDKNVCVVVIVYSIERVCTIIVFKMKKENKRKTCLIAGLSTGLLIARRASTSRPYERARTAINDCTRRSSISHIPFFFLFAYLQLYHNFALSFFFKEEEEENIFF